MLLATVRMGQALSSAIHRGEGVRTFKCKSRNTKLSAFPVNTVNIFRKLDKDRARTRMKFNVLGVTDTL